MSVTLSTPVLGWCAAAAVRSRLPAATPKGFSWQRTTATAAEPTGKRPGRAKKIVLGIVIALVVLVAAAAIAVFALFGHELTTLGSIQKVDDYPLYTMTYDGDYGMDEFLEQGGASNDSELIEFVIQRIMKGLPITIDLPDLACSTFNATTPEGDALFGRNFDLEYSPGMLVRTTPRGRLRERLDGQPRLSGLRRGKDAR